ncbi:MAG: hypothetical protein KAX80_05535, partial [Planctomycetes bacterium]|nr:hypothetical protein [Planctomycetota bacterium]
AAIASWIKRFRDGDIEAPMLEIGLSPLIDNIERVRLMRQVEESRARAAPDIIPLPEEDPLMAALRQETVRAHLDLFARRLLGIDELYAYLLADGLAEPLARSTALSQALKRIASPPFDSPYFQRDRLRPLLDEAIEGYTLMLEQGELSLGEYQANLLAVGVDPAIVTYLADTQEVRQFAQT